MVLSSYSKINLSLLVNSKQKSGLHNIQSYYCLINLKDKIKIKKIKGKSDRKRTSDLNTHFFRYFPVLDPSWPPKWSPKRRKSQ